MCIIYTRAAREPDGTIKIISICEKSGQPIARTTENGEFCEECYMHDGHEFKPDDSNNPLACEICGRHIQDHPDPDYDDWQESVGWK